MKEDAAMNNVSRPNGWVVVCDGGKALFLENVGSRFHPELKTRNVMKHETPPSRLLGASAPGRTQSGSDDRRAAMEETDFHARAEEEFLRTIGTELDRYVREQDIHALLLIAPARALGTLRKMLSEATRKIVSGELVRDLVKLPIHEIEQHLVDAP